MKVSIASEVAGPHPARREGRPCRCARPPRRLAPQLRRGAGAPHRRPARAAPPSPRPLAAAGANGCVVLAKHRATGELVAIKKLVRGHTGAPRAAEGGLTHS